MASATARSCSRKRSRRAQDRSNPRGASPAPDQSTTPVSCPAILRVLPDQKSLCVKTWAEAASRPQAQRVGTTGVEIQICPQQALEPKPCAFKDVNRAVVPGLDERFQSGDRGQSQRPGTQ